MFNHLYSLLLHAYIIHDADAINTRIQLKTFARIADYEKIRYLSGSLQVTNAETRVYSEMRWINNFDFLVIINSLELIKRLIC